MTDNFENPSLNTSYNIEEATSSFDTSDVIQKMPNPDFIDSQAEKYAFASGNRRKFEELRDQIASGNQEAIKEWFQFSREQTLADAKLRTQERILQQPMTRENAEILRDITNVPILEDKELAYPREFANKLTSSTVALMKNPPTDPELLDKVLNVSEDKIMKRELFNQLYIDNEKVLKENTIAGGLKGFFSMDTAELLVPGLSWYRYKDLAKREDLPFTFWKSNNIEELVQRIYSLPPKDAYAEADRITKELAAVNAYDALLFISSLGSFGTSDKALLDIETALDVMGVAQIAKTALVAAGAAGIAAVTLTRMRPATLAQAVGDLGLSARLNAVDELTKAARVTGSKTSTDDMLSTMPHLINPSAILSNTNTIASGATARVMQRLNQTATDLVKRIKDNVNVRRLEDDTPALATAFNEAEQYIKTHYSSLNNAIMNFVRVSSDEGLGNIAGVKALLGKRTEPLTRTEVRFKPGFDIDLKAANVPKRFGEAVAESFTPQFRANYEKFLERVRKNLQADPEYRLILETLTPEERQFVQIAEREGLFYPGATYQYDGVKDGVRLGQQEFEFSAPLDISKATKQTETIQIQVGTPQLTAFENPELAAHYANVYYKLPKGSYSIEQVGENFFIGVFKQIDETSPAVRRELAMQLNVPEQPGLYHAIGRRIGATEDIMGENVNTARKTGLAGATDLMKAVGDIANEQIGVLRKESRQRFNRFVESQQRYEDPYTGQHGKFNQTLASFEAEWRQMFGVRPTEAETNAYFHYTMLSDLDWGLNNINIYSKLNQQGYRQFAFSTKNQPMKDLSIVGKIVPDIIIGEYDRPRIILWDANDISNLREVTSLGDLKALKQQGYNIVRLAQHSDEVLRTTIPGISKHLPKDKIDYILTKDIKEGPLKWNQLPYQPGGHRVYPDRFFISSAQIVPTQSFSGKFFHRYTGDFNLASVRTKEQATAVAKTFEEARQALKANDNARLSYIVQTRFPTNITEADFRKFYADGLMNIDEPIRVRRNGANLFEAEQLARNPAYTNLQNLSDSDGLGIPFTSERGRLLGQASTTGGQTQAVVALSDARLLDPLSTLNQMTNRMARSEFFEDIKVKQVEEFIARFGDMLELPADYQSSSNLVRHLVDPVWKRNVVDSEKMAAAKAYRIAALEFMGTKTKESLAMRTIADNLLDTIFKYRGASGADVVETHLLHRIEDPSRFIRSLAFHKNLGLFNWTTYFTQMSQFTTMAAITGNPNTVAQASALTMYQRMMPLASNTVTKHLSKLAGQWVKPQWAQESLEAWNRSGLNTIGGATALLDDFVDQKIITTKFGNFLDAGRMFFDAGERHARHTAFNMAYLEWRKDNATAKLTDTALRSIIDRTDLLTGNMTRASQSWWQKGALSVPFQFHNWQLRMTEQMLGGRLEYWEKARIVLLNSLLYGVPAGASNVKLFGQVVVPWVTPLKNWAQSKGMEADENAAYRIMMEGLVPEALEYVTGDRWNVGQKYGPPSRNILKDAVWEDRESFIKFVTGAGGETIIDGLKLLSPFMYTIANLVNTNNNRATLEVEDFTSQFVKLFPTLNNVQKTYAVATAGTYLAKSGKTIAEVDNWKAIVIGATGLSPGVTVRTQDRLDYVKSLKSYRETLTKYIESDYRKMLEAGNRDDQKAYEEYHRRILASFELGGFTPSDRANVMYRMLQTHKTLADSVNEQFMKRGGENFNALIRELDRKKKD